MMELYNDKLIDLFGKDNSGDVSTVKIHVVKTWLLFLSIQCMKTLIVVVFTYIFVDVLFGSSNKQIFF